jgi:hypothetical protein
MNNGIEIDPAAAGAAAGVVAGGFAFLFLFIILFGIFLQLIAWAGMWKTASKAGQFGLLACIPIVQFFIWAIMAKKEAWWGILCLIPIVNLVIYIILLNEISKRFGRGLGTTLGLFFLPFIFWIILGFGDAEYQDA